MNRLLIITVPFFACMLFLVPSIFGQILFSEHPIANNFNEPWSVFPIDMDGDNDIDIVSSARLGHQFAWWENDGNQDFTIHTISYNSPFAMGIEAADMDNDDDIDIICSSQTNGVELWKNSGDQNFTRRIIGSWPFASFIHTADVDGNGYTDVIVACCEGGINRMGWIENDGGSSFIDHIVAEDWDHANSAYAEDVDSDGDVDLLGTASGRSTGTGEIAWFENDGNQVFTRNTIFSTSARPSCAIARDLDLDGDVDVVAAICMFNQIMWFENDGEQQFTGYVIGTGFGRPHSVDTADFDHDGDIDVIATAIDSDKIAWLENDGAQSFTQHEVTVNYDGAADVFAVDLDLDGDTDVLGTAHFADQIKWWENLGPSGMNDDPGPPLARFALRQNFPNPFNPRTTIQYQLPEDTRVVLKVFDLHGREVKTLVDGGQARGSKSIVWNGTDNTGREVGSGVYIYKIQTDIPGFEEQSKKMLLIK